VLAARILAEARHLLAGLLQAAEVPRGDEPTGTASSEESSLLAAFFRCEQIRESTPLCDACIVLDTSVAMAQPATHAFTNTRMQLLES
jgi:hypothetical protein